MGGNHKDGKEMKKKEMKMMLWQAWCERSAGSSDTFLTIYIRAQAVRYKGQQHGDRAVVRATHSPQNKYRLVPFLWARAQVQPSTSQIRLERLLLLSCSRSRGVDRAESIPEKTTKGCYEKEKKVLTTPDSDLVFRSSFTSPKPVGVERDREQEEAR